MRKFSSIIISLESDVSLKLWLKYRLIGFRIFANRGDLTPEKVSMVKTATLTLHNPLRFKARDSYPQKSPVDKIQSSGSYIQGEWLKSSTANLRE